MSRSRRKYPIGGHGSSPSEKWDKQHCNRTWRARVHLLIKQERYDDCTVDDYSLHAANNWSWSKDGKGWYLDDHDGNSFRRSWSLIRNRRKYAQARMPQHVRSLSQYQYFHNSRGGWKLDQSMRK